MRSFQAIKIAINLALEKYSVYSVALLPSTKG